MLHLFYLLKIFLKTKFTVEKSRLSAPTNLNKMAMYKACEKVLKFQMKKFETNRLKFHFALNVYYF